MKHKHLRLTTSGLRSSSSLSQSIIYQGVRFHCPRQSLNTHHPCTYSSGPLSEEGPHGPLSEEQVHSKRCIPRTSTLTRRKKNKQRKRREAATATIPSHRLGPIGDTPWQQEKPRSISQGCKMHWIYCTTAQPIPEREPCEQEQTKNQQSHHSTNSGHSPQRPPL